MRKENEVKVIRKTTIDIQAAGIATGDELMIDGALWRALRIKDGKALIWKHTGLDQETVFNENNSNVYEGSDLQNAMKALPIPEELRDLITEEGFFALSIEEIRELLPTENDRIAIDKEGNTVWWWTRSANRGYGCYVWNVTPSGLVSNFGAAHYSFTLAPACEISII